MYNLRNKNINELEQYKLALSNPMFHISHKTPIIGIHVDTNIDICLKNALQTSVKLIKNEIENRIQTESFWKKWYNKPITILVKLNEQIVIDIKNGKDVHSNILKLILEKYNKQWSNHKLDTSKSGKNITHRNLYGALSPNELIKNAESWNGNYQLLYNSCINAENIRISYNTPDKTSKNMLPIIIASMNNEVKFNSPYMIIDENIETLMNNKLFSEIKQNPEQYAIIKVNIQEN